MAEIKKIKSNFVKMQAERYLSNITINDVVEHFIYNNDLGMFGNNGQAECDAEDPFDYYEQVENDNTELKEMVLNKIKELILCTR